ncbi:hypothetical protein TNCT_544411, partial [Trichonephila clavata]
MPVIEIVDNTTEIIEADRQ